MKNLENYGVQEMSAMENITINGGIAHYYEYGGYSGYDGGSSCIHENADTSSFPGDNSENALMFGNWLGHWLFCE